MFFCSSDAVDKVVHVANDGIAHGINSVARISNRAFATSGRHSTCRRQHGA